MAKIIFASRRRDELDNRFTFCEVTGGGREEEVTRREASMERRRGRRSSVCAGYSDGSRQDGGAAADEVGRERVARRGDSLAEGVFR